MNRRGTRNSTRRNYKCNFLIASRRDRRARLKNLKLANSSCWILWLGFGCKRKLRNAIDVLPVWECNLDKPKVATINETGTIGAKPF